MNKEKLKQLYVNTYNRALDAWGYVSDGVWRDTRNIWWVNVIKTLNLTVRSFLDSDLQSKACAMAFRTMLAIVPALALLFAIGRGFGFQSMLEEELYTVFPAQKVAITKALEFVDSYLSQSEEGIFVGIGIALLLWTLISLVINVENQFNRIWSLKTGRNLWRKITDYTAMLLILPVLMICASGLTIFVSSSLQTIFHFEFMTPVIQFILESASWVFTWLFFAAVFILIPNTKVNKRNALIAGVIAGTGFRVLQWLFVTGQLYVTRYNAIYGSFAFLPLLLIWMQLTWVITLSGSLLCYASQNIFQFSFQSDINRISIFYRQKVAVGLAAVITRAFVAGEKVPTQLSLTIAYGIPSKLVSEEIDRLVETGILSRVVIDPKSETYGLQPAVDPHKLSVKYVVARLENYGSKDFISNFDKTFAAVDDVARRIAEAAKAVSEEVLIKDLDILPAEQALTGALEHDHIKLRSGFRNKHKRNHGDKDPK